MLARLLRRLIFSQIVLGVGLGYLLHRLAGASWWTLAWLPPLVPLGTTLVVGLVTAHKSKADEPFGHWWRSVVGETIASVRIFLLRQPWTLHPPRVLQATAEPARVPVVLVHGYLCNHRIWDSVAPAMRSQGHSVLAVDLEPVFTSIDRYVPIVEAAVDDICKQTGAAQVALVGHSMGGLAIRAWMRDHGTDRVAKVLTLGTPHAGTQIEAKSYTPNGQQMQWQSTWLAELLAQEPKEHHALIHIALTPQDNIVFPQRAQVLPGAVPTVFDGIGHLQMCLSPAVMAWVCAQLAGLPLHTRLAPAPTQPEA